MNDVFLLLGSNIEKEKNLPTAVSLIEQLAEVTAVSAIYESAPVGFLAQASFFNAAVRIRTPLSAAKIKREIIGQVEAALHRVRTSNKNAPRTIDVDIVLFNEEVFEYEGGRQIPDPDLYKFPHVAVPIAEIAGDKRDPKHSRSLSEIANELMAKAIEKSADKSPLWRRDDISLSLKAYP